MAAEKTEAIVIRQTDFSETSRVIVLYTKDFGKVSLLAKGARRLKSRFEAALDLLARCHVVFLPKSTGLGILTEAELLSRFQPHHDLPRLYAGYYIAELLAGLTEENDPHPDLHDAASSALDGLSASEGDWRTLLLRFELQLLEHTGHLPGLDHCLQCGSSIQPGATYAYWVSQGGLLCAACRRHQDGPTIGAGSLAVLSRLKSDFPLERLSLSQPQARECRRLVTSIVCHLLERRPKMLRYLDFS